MKITLEITGPELTMLYLSTGNADAGRIVTEASRRDAQAQPKKPRKPREAASLAEQEQQTFKRK